jgi:hypothetical protein
VLAASPIPPAKLPLIAKAALSECDGRDGVVDGLISDPRRCRFDPGALACPGAVDRSDCLTKPQIASLRKLYGGPRNSAGEQLFPGWEPGLEDLVWPSALVNTGNGGPGQLLVQLPDNFSQVFRIRTRVRSAFLRLRHRSAQAGARLQTLRRKARPHGLCEGRWEDNHLRRLGEPTSRASAVHSVP